MIYLSYIIALFGAFGFTITMIKAYNGNVSIESEICSVLWFILAVLIYGVFK